MKKRAWKKTIISPETPIFEAIKVLNEEHFEIVMITDPEGKLLGVVCDPDVRRAVLSRVSLDAPVSQIMIKSPVVAFKSNEDREIMALMKRTGAHQIPIIDFTGKLVGLKCISDFLAPEPLANKVVLMSGGMGTRLHPITESIPKSLVEVNGKPILFILIDSLMEAGFHDITISINYKGEMIREAVAAQPRYLKAVTFIEETQRLGTAGALSLLEDRPAKSLFVINSDIITSVDYKAMMEFHRTAENEISMAVREEKYQVPYGVVQVDGNKVTRIVEKPEQKFFISSGIYLLKPDLIDFVPKNKYFDMPSLIEKALGMGMKVGSFPVHEYWMDIGRPAELQKARDDSTLRLARNA